MSYISPNGPSAFAPTENPVALPSERQKELEERRQLPRDLMGGTDVMRAAKTHYAPQHPAEADSSYAARIAATTLYGGFSQTVVRQAGKLFTKPVTIVDAAQTILDFSLDVDGEGRSITSFSNDAAKDAFVDGISFIFVDFPKVPEGATMADVNVMGARPYWVLLNSSKLLGWKSVNAGGNQILTQLRFKEEKEEPVDEFTTAMVKQIRVLDLGGFYRVYRKVRDEQGKEDWGIVEAGRASWIEIPVIPIYTNRVGFFEGLPPLRELAELNQEHWSSSSEQRRALSFGRFGMLKVIGRPPAKGPAVKQIEIAPDTVIDVPIGGDAGVVETSGAGLAAGLADLQAIEKRMQSSGMVVRVENAGAVTATASAIDSQETNAALKAIAKGIETALNEALLITGTFLRVPRVGVAKVYDEFAEAAQGNTSDFVALYGAGLASKRRVWDELVRRHIYDDDFDPDEEEALIAAEMPTLESVANDPNAPQLDEQGNPVGATA